jgi:hypothetical protein
METFTFFIPLAVVAAMGLSTDGQTISREVRVSDLLADGQLTVDEYLAMAKAGVVFMPFSLFTFQSVEEAAEGWVCSQLEPEPLAWEHTLAMLKKLFPGGKSHVRDWQLWLPEPPPRGRYFHRVEVYTEDVVGFNPYRYYRYIHANLYRFAEGTVSITKGENHVWEYMYLYKFVEREFPSYFAAGGRYRDFKYEYEY